MPEEQTPRPAAYSQAPARNSLGVPIAIVIAAAIIAGAIIFADMGNGTNPIQKSDDALKAQETADVVIPPVTEKDHIRGNPNAPVVIVEYSDYDCPFCKSFHDTMNKIMAEYGANGQVAWVFRQFPLAQLHPNAPKTAAASECVAQLGGNDAFWKYTDLVYGDRTTNEPANLAKLPEYAQTAGVDKAKYNECVQAGTYDAAIAASVAEALKTGARGTPYSILMYGNQKGVINGAQPYATVKAMIDEVLKQLGENKATE